MRFGDGQIYGLIAVLAILNILGLFWVVQKPAPENPAVPFAEDGPDMKFVEIAGDGRGNGIYFAPGHMSIRDLLEKAEISGSPADPKDSAILAKKIENGTKLVVARDRLRLEKISSSKRYALHKPMDLNEVGEKDLVLVPGIGEKTAKAILERREASGKFGAVDDLLDVPGIGPKKFDKFKGYFFIGHNS